MGLSLFNYLDIQAALDKLTLHRNMTQVSPIVQQTRELDLLASSPKVVQKTLTVPAKVCLTKLNLSNFTLLFIKIP